MTPREALNRRIYEARARFRYIPDADKDADWIEQWAADRFNTPAETEARKGIDCDDFAVFALIRGYELVAHLPDPGRWSLVLGNVRQAGQWLGHAWVELIVAGERLWADPTWGELCQSPAALGWPATRRPLRLFPFDSSVFDGPIAFQEVAP